MLGEIQAHRDGITVSLGPTRQRTVLAALLMDVNRVVPIEGLADRVWGAQVPQRVGPALYSYLSRLRQVLDAAPGDASRGAAATEQPSIARRPGGYALLADPGAVDVHVFHDLVTRARAADDDRAIALFDRALGLWRGEPFAGVDKPWFNSARGLLSEMRHACRLDRNDLELRRGRHAVLLAELANCHEAHPLDERLAAQFMLALYRSGRTAEALRCFERVRCALVEELGSDPGPELRQLHQRVLAGDPLVDVSGWPGAADGATAVCLMAAAGGAAAGGAAGAVPAASGAAGAVPAVSGTAGAVPAASGTTGAVPATGLAMLRESTVPRQLPATPGWFTGRWRELAILDQALQQAGRGGGAVPVCVVSGGGGIGKTSLALHWAHRNTDRFPQGQLYVDLRGFDLRGEPLAPAAAIRGFLDALGVDPGSAPVDPQALTGLYRSLVADRRMLIVLDNAANAEQVAALLPGGAGSAVLVTSRRRLTELAVTHGAHLLPLDVFSASESRDLLGRHLGEDRVCTDPEAVAAMLEHCAGLPLAISIAAARATARTGFPLAAFAAELQDESARLDALDAGSPSADVRAACLLSYRTLGAGAAEAFRFLAVAPGPEIGLAAAASLLGRSPAATRAALRELEAVHLLEQHAPGRYRMNDLIRLYAAEYRTAEPCERAVRRVLDFYLQTAAAGDRALGPYRRRQLELEPPLAGVTPQPLADRRAARSWFRAERTCLLAAQQLADRQGWDTLVWQLARALDGFLEWQEQPHDQAAVWRRGLAAAERLGAVADRAWAHRRLADACTRTGDRTGARRHTRLAHIASAESAGLARGGWIHDVLAWSPTGRGRSAPPRHLPCLA
ncbi:NB-ARC domain-containing protein [Kitasatospora sp. NBC_01250]|uniref:AfsR/SARP family transcriptional regulator n=1 Tax=Kitasatospora sp. NBC_01250 TaxID=2903571 RepID=UPI002E326DDD|nr:BTAD domain-containing putative transcriptional regulator [Kitasatospora sp. NBC_01250]